MPARTLAVKRTPAVGAVSALVIGLVLGCSTYRDNLTRGERLYQANQFDESLALCRLMERDVDALTRGEQARYAYLRGMTDYQLGFRADARHWLAIARAIHEQEAGGLDADALATSQTTLDELNREVYGLTPGNAASGAVAPSVSAVPSVSAAPSVSAPPQAPAP
jgi:hypothetical protein